MNEHFREYFLKNLKGRTSKYKRYGGNYLPLRYAGGKSLAVGYIVERIPNHVEKLVSPFFGGGSLEIAVASELNVIVQGYDIFEMLTIYWQQQINNPDALADMLETFSPSSEYFYNVNKPMIMDHFHGRKLIDNDLEIAARHWYGSSLSYGPGAINTWQSKQFQDPKKYKRLVDKVRKFECDNLTVSCMPFEQSIPLHQNDFMYVDPPYYIGGDSKMFAPLYPARNLTCYHDGFNHEKLAELLHDHNGGFILSYNDCTPIREMYADFHIEEISWKYSMGTGETRSRDTEAGEHIKQSHELLITG